MSTAWRPWVPLMIVAAGVAASVSPAAAVELEKNTWEVGGYIVHTGYNNDSTISDSFGWGVRGGYLVKPAHEFEFTFGMESADDSTKGSSVTYNISRWTVDYVHNLKSKKPESKVAPLIIFGLGNMAYDGRGESDRTTVFEAGGGVRVFFTKKFAMRIDAKIWHFHGDGVIIPDHGNFAFDIDLGVSYVFGGGA